MDSRSSRSSNYRTEHLVWHVQLAWILARGQVGISMSTQMFLVHDTGRCRLVMRRFRFSGGSGHSCNAHVVIDEDAKCAPRDEKGYKPNLDRTTPLTDPRWPNVCSECGLAFDISPDCGAQVNELDWIEGGGHRFVYGVGHWAFPAGAVLRSLWRDVEGRPPAYQIGLPNGTVWNTNDRASVSGSNTIGPYWEVSGEAPNFTVTPSIDDQGSNPWHGFITNGILTP